MNTCVLKASTLLLDLKRLNRKTKPGKLVDGISGWKSASCARRLFLSQHVLNNSARSQPSGGAASLQFNLKSGACGRPFVGAERHLAGASGAANEISH